MRVVFLDAVDLSISLLNTYATDSIIFRLQSHCKSHTISIFVKLRILGSEFSHSNKDLMFKNDLF